MKKTKKHAYETSYQFGIIWQKTSIKEKCPLKGVHQKSIFSIKVWRWNVLITMFEGIMLLNF